MNKTAILKRILRSLEESGSLDYCNNRMNEYIEHAVSNIQALRNSTFKSHLVQMARSLRISDESSPEALLLLRQ